jgi:heptosyltransferase-1
MSGILFIKTSSLGDVVHHMPALTEARRHLPHARFSWVVEQAFAPLARLHPAVDLVIPVASRRWRGALLQSSTWRELREFRAALRRQTYDAIVDTQGLMRTALMAKLAQGLRHGYARDSIREPLASLLYDVTHQVDRQRHAIDRNRLLTGLALGYTPQGTPDYGLDRAIAQAGDGRYGVLLHATSRPDKEWGEANWVALGKILGSNVRLVLPWGSAGERARSERIAAQIPRAHVPDRRPLDDVARLIAGAAFVVGVDTGLLHLAAALRVPLVAIFMGSFPALTGPWGGGPIAIVGAPGAPPAVAEVAAALETVRAACDAR